MFNILKHNVNMSPLISLANDGLEKIILEMSGLLKGSYSMIRIPN